MKKTINAAIGGCSFAINDDAYALLDNYLERFKTASNGSSDNILEELEVRIADLLKAQLGGRQVIDRAMAQRVIGQLGYPEGYKEVDEQEIVASANEDDDYYEGSAPRKLYRDTDDKRIAGVCSGLALFFGLDVVLMRIIFLFALICGSAGFWIYVIIWIAAPEARTAAQKCEVRGIPATAENIRKFTQSK